MRAPALILAVLALVATTSHFTVSDTSGEEATGTASGAVYSDTDADGIRDAGEPGLAGWQVTIEGDTLDEEFLKHETETDRRGFYSFEGIPPGDYSVAVPCEGQPSLWVNTSPDGSNEFGLTFEGNDDFDDLDFALRVIETPVTRNAAIAGRFVWDENRDGTPQPSEPGPAGWRVTAYMLGAQCLPSEYQQVAGYTGTDGSFQFEDVVPGPYEIGTDGLPRNSDHFDYVQDSPGTTGHTADGWEYFSALTTVEAPSDGVGTIEIGLLRVTGSNSISGTLYRDFNLDGNRDPGEPGIAGSTMVGLAYRTPHGYALMGLLTTDASYEFAGLAAGDFLVGALLGGKPVNPPGGADGVPETTVTLAEGEQRTGVDFGFEPVPGEPSSETPEAQPTSPAVPTAIASPASAETPGPPNPVTAPATGDGSSYTRVPYALVFALSSVGLTLIAISARRRIPRREP